MAPQLCSSPHFAEAAPFVTAGADAFGFAEAPVLFPLSTSEAILIHTASVRGFLVCYAHLGGVEKSRPTANISKQIPRGVMHELSWLWARLLHVGFEALEAQS